MCLKLLFKLKLFCPCSMLYGFNCPFICIEGQIDHICKHYFSWGWVMLGKAKEAVWPPWALVSRKEVPRDFGGWSVVTERSEVDWPMGAAILKKSGSLPLTHTKSCRPPTSLSILWHTEGGWKACLRVWNSKREESGRKGRFTGCSFRIHE